MQEIHDKIVNQSRPPNNGRRPPILPDLPINKKQFSNQTINPQSDDNSFFNS